jgi:hypothetical protein
MATLNANFANQAAFSFFNELKRKWVLAYTKSTPFLGMLKGKGRNFNAQRYRTTQGLFEITPIGLADFLSGGATPETSVNQFTPQTPEVTNGATQAQYYYATYKKAAYITNQEQTQLIGGTNWLSVIEYQTKRLMENFRLTVGKDIVGTQQDQGLIGTGQVLGEQYPLSTTNSPGNISQSGNTSWQAGVSTNAGSFNELLVTNEIDRISDLGRGEADFVQCSYTASNNVYAKFYSLVANTQALTREEDHAQFGFKTWEYRGVPVFRDGRLGDTLPGSMVVGSSDTWMWNTDSPEPVLATINGEMRILGTLAIEFMHWWTVALGIDDPARNTLVTGIG